MSDIKSKVQDLDPFVKAQNVQELIGGAENIYEALTIISKRAKQLSVNIKEELHNKLEEFAVSTEAIQEVQENKEQIEISKFYERLPNAVIIATNEYQNGDLTWRYDKEDPAIIDA